MHIPLNKPYLTGESDTASRATYTDEPLAPLFASEAKYFWFRSRNRFVAASLCSFPDLPTSAMGSKSVAVQAMGVDQTNGSLPLPRSRIGSKLGGQNEKCPVREQKSDRLLRLPYFSMLSSVSQDQVIHWIGDFF